MREIKFRYTCKRDNGHTFSEVFSLEQIEAGDAKKWIEANFVGMFHLTKSEYTGTKDKNDKEIYEGDVVDIETHQDREVLYYVAYDGCCWFLKGNPTFDEDYLTNFMPDELQVIGNIYENPKLLNALAELRRNN